MFARKGGKSYARYRVDDSAACRSKATGAHALGWAERGSRGRRGRVLGPILLVGLMPGGDRRECVSPIRMQEAGRQNQKGAEEVTARRSQTQQGTRASLRIAEDWARAGCRALARVWAARRLTRRGRGAKRARRRGERQSSSAESGARNCACDCLWLEGDGRGGG